MSINIAPPEKPETQTERIQLNTTPRRKARLTAAAKHYGCSVNSLINQLSDGALVQLEEQAGVNFG